MKQTQAFISTYTADVSGVCSALFELGGMTVMHDASGCNSTYNTHDEPRWYDMDSLVFISGLSEMEALMGDDEKLIGDITAAAKDLQPAFIAVAGTPIPMMTGCDIPSIAARIESKTDVPCFGLTTNGMHSYIQGVGMALAAYAQRMTDSNVQRTAERSVNIIGATPLDFSVNGAVDSMKGFLSANGWNVVGTWAMGSTPEELQAAGSAHVNLVVSYAGMAVAEALKEKFGTPYVIGTPYGEEFGRVILENLGGSSADGQDRIAFSFFDPTEGGSQKADLFIIGESVTSRSLAAAIRLKYGKRAAVLCPLESGNGVLSAGDAAVGSEEGLIERLNGAEMVIADPLYKKVVPSNCAWKALAHEACSGRIFRKAIPNLIPSIESLFEE